MAIMTRWFAGIGKEAKPPCFISMPANLSRPEVQVQVHEGCLPGTPVAQSAMWLQKQTETSSYPV